MKDIKSSEYKEYKIYFPPKEKMEELWKIIIDNTFKLNKVLKDTKRNYVAIVEINNKKYFKRISFRSSYSSKENTNLL